MRGFEVEAPADSIPRHARQAQILEGRLLAFGLQRVTRCPHFAAAGVKHQAS